LSLLNYKYIKGEKPCSKTIVFLHGFLESLTMWDDFNFQDFHFNSLLIDLPGHGESVNDDDGEPSINFFSKKINQLINSLDISEFSIVGHSMGGYVALNYKDIYPSKVSKIVLLNSNFWTDSIQKKKDRLRVAEIVRSNKMFFIREAIPNLFLDKVKFGESIDKLLSEASKMDAYDIAYSSLAIRGRNDYDHLVRVLGNNLMIIQGEKDEIIPEKLMREMVKGLDLEFRVVEKTGHMTPIEAKDDVLLLLNNYI
jgi:pimeloyl-ACP methyl ester carboxylesterase